MFDATSLAMPRRPALGRPTLEGNAAYETALDAWCNGIKWIAEECAKDPDGFDVSSGWCYLMEEHGLKKGDFDEAQRLINDCRKDGRLPLDICCEDERRSPQNLEYIDSTDPTEEAEAIIERMNEAEENYFPFSFWDAQDTYVQMMVEKVDLKNLFAPISAPFRIPTFNAAGWGDLHSRAGAMARFAYWERKGKWCVLLYCGDLDPGGLRISDAIRSNLADMSGSVGWSPDRLIIDRFGIDKTFIDENHVPWINNLHTSKGKLPLDDPKHPDHNTHYVQNYIKVYGARKVEATVLVQPRLVEPARALPGGDLEICASDRAGRIRIVIKITAPKSARRD